MRFAARWVLVLGLIAGCSPSPASPGPTLAPATQLPASVVPGVQAPSQATSTALPSPSAAASLGLTWQPFPRLERIIDMAHSGLGWVALEDCGPNLCSPATVWSSPDLEVWDRIDLGSEIRPISVSANSDSFLLAAYRYDDVGAHGSAFVELWRSTDGRSWERAGELALGPCDSERCPGVRGVGVAPTGAIAVGDVKDEDDHPIDQSAVSRDGARWRETTIADYSNGTELERIVVQGMESTPTDLFVFGHACGGVAPATCTTTVWSTIDGGYWSEDQSFPSHSGRIALASSGVERVVAVTTCEPASPDACTTDVWTGLKSREWRNVGPGLDLAVDDVAWTGDAYVMVAQGDGGFVTSVSENGADWTEVPSEQLGAAGGCGATWLAAGAGNVLFGSSTCGVWRGTTR